jgi:hypothetical protein
VSSVAPSPAGPPVTAAHEDVAPSDASSATPSPAGHPASTAINGVGTVGALFHRPRASMDFPSRRGAASRVRVRPAGRARRRR